jgi:hypothetical protein
MKVLIIHHLEPIWEPSYIRMGAGSFEAICWQFIEHLEENHYDKVILTQFEHWKPQNEHYLTGIANFINPWEEYAYGWDRDLWDDEHSIEGIDYAPGNLHSETVRLDDWMRDLRNADVYISGAFDGECIDDLETALKFLNIPYKRVEELII